MTPGKEPRPAIDHSLLSPSGRISKRAKRVAMAREAARLFPPGFWDRPKKTEAGQRAEQKRALLRKAKELRELAARGMCPRKFVKEAERLEAQAHQVDEA